MQLKSFSWAEQIFTAYFAANCFAWRQVLPLGLARRADSCIHTPWYQGATVCEQVAGQRALRKERPCGDVAGVSQADVPSLPPPRLGESMTSAEPQRRPKAPALRVRRASGPCPPCGGAALCWSEPHPSDARCLPGIWAIARELSLARAWAEPLSEALRCSASCVSWGRKTPGKTSELQKTSLSFPPSESRLYLKPCLTHEGWGALDPDYLGVGTVD